MQITEVLTCLGSNRVIWIDDCFDDTPQLFARSLISGLETAKSCAFPELVAALDVYGYDPDQGEVLLIQALADVQPERFAEMKALFSEKDQAEAQSPANELPKDARDTICALLNVGTDDRWTFEQADAQIERMIDGDDEGLSYLVDLSQADGSKVRGLDILIGLHRKKSAGTALVLTHEATTATESDKEVELLDLIKTQLGEGHDGVGLPVCVVSKERLQTDSEDAEAINNALRIALKRAGLRRSLHEVLSQAKTRVLSAYREAVEILMRVPPEQLEAHVIERGRREGVSELHVVERAITAHLGQKIRDFFGTDATVQNSTARLRTLREIPLDVQATATPTGLAPFRTAEVWESDALLNASFTPLACGDVFEADPVGNPPQGIRKRFLLLGQPCDIALRADGKRDAATAFFVPLKRKAKTASNASNPKSPFLPFLLEGETWCCDFREATVVNLSILDLSTMRTDGRVGVDDGQTPPAHLLPGQDAIYADRIGPAVRVLDAAQPVDKEVLSSDLLLTFKTTPPFKMIHNATFEAATPAKKDSAGSPKRVTWKLTRTGRIRMPYAAAMLEQFVGVMSRHAFDLDYMNPGLSEEPAPAAAAPDNPDTSPCG